MVYLFKNDRGRFTYKFHTLLEGRPLRVGDIYQELTAIQECLGQPWHEHPVARRRMGKGEITLPVWNLVSCHPPL